MVSLRATSPLVICTLPFFPDDGRVRMKTSPRLQCAFVVVAALALGANVCGVWGFGRSWVRRTSGDIRPAADGAVHALRYGNDPDTSGGGQACPCFSRPGLNTSARVL